MFNTLPLRRVEEHSMSTLDRDTWPATIPAVRQLLDEGLDSGPLTIFVGENGTGKSTIVEAIAQAFGLNVEGGTHNAVHRTQETESDLGEHLQLIRSIGSRKGVFLRAETMHQHFAYLDTVNPGGRHNFQSHGESFIEFFSSRADITGLWIFDEAESALSFNGCLALLAQIQELINNGSQVILSTHSPILAAMPGAQLYQLGDWGLRESTYDDLEMVKNWRVFLDSPKRFLHHFLDDETP